jgi:dihydrofolate reductase
MYELVSIITENGNIIENIPTEFYIPEDLKRFKEITSNHIVVMGRKTFDTLKKPLINRINIVITKNSSYQNNTNLFFCKLEELDNLLNSLNNLNKKIFIIGGCDIYNQLFDKCDKLHLTIVYKDINCQNQLSMNKINSNYEIISESEVYYSDNEKCNYKYISYQKN